MLPALTLLTSLLGPSTPTAVSGVTNAVGATGLLGSSAPTPAPSQDFGSVLTDVAKNTVSNLKKAETTSADGIQGQASVQQVAEAVTSAQQSLQMALSVRDKVVSAYQEISRMTM